MNWKQKFKQKPINLNEIVAYEFEKEGKKVIAPAKAFEAYLKDQKEKGIEPEAHKALTRQFCLDNKVRFTP